MRALVAVLSLVLLAPAGAPVARVLGSRGVVQLKRDGQFVRAADGAPVYESDVVVVPPGGLLVLRVEQNEQVVRVDEDLELPVSQVAALRAPRATRTLEQQLESVLSPRERRELGQERLAGWVVRPLAANVGASLPESAAARSALVARIQEKRQERELDRRMDRLTRDDGLFDDSDRKLSKTERSLQASGTAASDQAPNSMGGGGVSSVTGTDARVQVGAPGRSRGSDEEDLSSLEAQLRALDARASPRLDDHARACLLGALENLAAPARAALGPSFTVTLRREGASVAVLLEGALPVPDCVQDWAEGAGAELADGASLTVELPLP